jgi:alcohol dehydrogenase
MENFSFYSPTYFSFGKGSEANIGSLVKRFGGSKVLLHFGGGSVKKNGVYDAAVSSLNASGIPFIELGGVLPNPRSGLVYQGIELCRKNGVDFILAIGGGSTIDSAKAIALGVPYEGDFWDFYSNPITVEKALPVATVLTIAAAGSEGSPDTVITNEKDLHKWAAHGDVLRPKFSILNPQYTTTLDAYQTAVGITDIMAHILERYFTNTQDVETTDCMCEGLLRALVAEAPKVVANLADYQARANIMWAGMVAHNNICGVGRQQDWASHDIEHLLSSLFDVTHGAGLAVVFPAWMQYVVKHDIARFSRLANIVWNCKMNQVNPEETALEGIACFKNFLRSMGMPLTLGELGIKESDIRKLVDHAKINGQASAGNFVHLDAKDIAAVLALAL